MSKTMQVRTPSVVLLEDVREILRNALSLINRPWTWTKRAEALDADGQECGAVDEQACAFCSIGAIAAAAPDWDRERPLRYAAYELLAKSAGRQAGDCDALSFVAQWNDDDQRLHGEVVTAFTKAIEGDI